MRTASRASPMPPLLVRDATPDDAEGLVPLLDALGYPADRDTIAVRLRALSDADPTGRVIVAVDGDEIAGFAVLHSTPVLHRSTAVGRITGIAVRPSVQGRGVGRELLRAAEEHFRAHGLARIEVTSGLTHTAAYQFYRRLGYANQGVRFAKSLIEG
jgi:ribosomal protein S18 acetylase RimI-like enzyme